MGEKKFLLVMRTLTIYFLNNFHLHHPAVVTIVIIVPYIPSSYLSYNWKFVPFDPCSFTDSFIQYVQSPPGSNISIFIIIYSSQNYLTPGFRTFVFVVVIFGGQHLNLIRFWVQTTWKLYVS